MNLNNTMTICWKLNEHDAALMLRLIQREAGRTDKVWQPYWQRLAADLQQTILDSHRGPGYQSRRLDLA